MKRKPILMVILLSLIIAAVPLLAGCGSSSSGSVTDIQQNVTVGKRVFVDDSGIVFFGYNNLLCSAKMEGSELSEFVVEGGMTGTIHALAVYDNYIYVSDSDGFFRYPLDMFTSGQSSGSAENLMKNQHLDYFNHFEIFEGKIFYLYGYTLYYIPAEGGDATKVAEEVYDFEVSDKGIYVVEQDGDMKVISPDLDDEKEIGEIAENQKFTVGGAKFYYRSEDSLQAYSVETEKSEALNNQNTPNEFYVPWSNGTNVFYSTDKFEYILLTPSGEQDMGKGTMHPGKAEGFVYGDYLISTVTDYQNMQVVDMANGEVKVYNLENELKEYLDQINGGSGGQSAGGSRTDSGGTSGGSTGGTNGGSASSGDYDITKGSMRNASEDGSIQYLYFNDFMITLPNKSYIGYDNDKDSVTFYYLPGRDSGYGGRLVTIKAYDLDDNSYETLPSYHIAGTGKNVGKRFIAIFPTDAQWDTNDQTQTEEYQDLSTYLHKIGEGAVNSPLQTADSD